MVNRLINKEKKSGGMSFPVKKISITLIFLTLIFVLLSSSEWETIIAYVPEVFAKTPLSPL